MGACVCACGREGRACVMGVECMCGEKGGHVWREGRGCACACVRRWRAEDAYSGKCEEVVSQFILDSPEETDNRLTGSTPSRIDINHCKEEGGRK